MQIPKRKSENYTRAKPDMNITKAKFDELKKKVENLKKSHPIASEEVKRLAKMGDFSENFSYQIAKGRFRSINSRILEIENVLNHAVIIETKKNSKTIQLGCEVFLEIAGKKKKYLILGSSETNPSKGVISHSSPIGSALMGCEAGDKVKIKLEKGEIVCRIIEIL